MQLDARLRERLDELFSAYGRQELLRSAAAISERYRTRRDSDVRFIQSAEDAAAYALSRMPATYCAVAKALTETLARTGLRPSSLLDVGAGTGSATLAALAVLPACKAYCIEAEPLMRCVGERLTADLPVTWAGANIEQKLLDLPITDMTICSYMLNESAPDQRIRIARSLFQATQGLLLVVEPGTPSGYQALMNIREALVQDGAQILAPCPHSAPCPLTHDDWCHFTVRAERSKVHKLLKGGDAPYEDEKFCYSAFSHRPGHPATRVLRHPVIEPRSVQLSVCTPNGIQPYIVRKGDPLYRVARKAGSGDAWPET